MTRIRVAVTGASGFIGRHVIKELARHSAAVTAVTRDAEKLSDIGENVRVVEMDIADTRSDVYVRLNRPDVLIHLAWDGLPNYKSLHHFETVMPRHYIFLKGLIEAGLPALLVTGTCFEYGMQEGQLSEDVVTMPANPYAYAKDALRRQLDFLRAINPFDLTWARLFYMYGEGQHEGSLYPQLRSAVLRGEQVFDMSGGEQVRDYLPVNQVAQYIVRLAMAKNRNVGTVNVCSGEPVKLVDLVDRWLEENGWTLKLNLGHYPYPDYEPMESWGSRQKLDALLM